MLGFLERIGRKGWLREIDQFALVMAGMDDEEMGTAVVLTEDVRVNFLKETGIDLNFPHAAIARQPTIPFDLSAFVRKGQRLGVTIVLPGFLVWTHTTRAATFPELRLRAREVWGHLQRGLPHLEHGFGAASIILKRAPLWIGDRKYPDGFAPFQSE